MAHHDPTPSSDPTIDAPTVMGTAGADTLREGPGTEIGAYRLLRLIGEGGFGSVFLAEQERPVRRQVALKIIKLGMDTRQVVARFEQERQALAILDHPNIAKVFDAGATATGRPYFVMELCTGEPIDRYCDRNNLAISERLELFGQVCSAVQHAHTKGLIHRDIKPSNVLVSARDGKAHAKVIDFGIAKATASKLTEKTLFTEHRQMIGTPEYMSPEQAEGSLDIDTRTDVYSLGVLLYELLTGSTPFDSRSLRAAAYGEIQRIIREVEPPRPSTRLSQNTDTIANVAAHRHTEPRRLGTIIRGELDWIVMKALEKDRTRRYETASGLALDIQRYLSGEAVVAAPPSTAYRLRKFARRNRIAVGTGGAVAASLVLGIVAFAWQAGIARDQRDRAVHAEEQTSKRADELQQVADYQARMLQQVDVKEAGVRLMSDLRTRHDAALEKSKVPAAEKSARTEAFERELHVVNATDAAVALLDRTVMAPAVRAIEAQFADQPLVDASLRTTMGVVYEALGRPEEALPLYQRAYALRATSLGEENVETLASRFGVGSALGELQRLAEAETTVRATLEAYRRVLGEDDAKTLAAKRLLAVQMSLQGKYEECEAITRDVLERRRRVLGPEHADTLEAMNDLGRFLMARGKYADAVKVLREVVEAQRRVADSSVAGTLGNLGIVLNRQREYAAAEPCLREALERQRRDKGEDHPETQLAIANLAATLMDAGKLGEAESLARESLEKSRRIHGNEHADTLKSMNIMGQVLYRQNKFTETEPYYREALVTGRRVLGEEHPDTIIWIANLGFVLQRLGRLEEAEPYFREALDKNRRQMGETHPYTLAMARNLSDLLRQQNKLADAEVLLREALETTRRVEGNDHPETLTMIRTMADVLRQRAKFVEAEALMREALEISRRRNGEDHADTLALIGLLGSVLRDQGKLAEAETYFQESIEKNRRLHGEEHADTLLAILRMGSLYVAQRKYAETVAVLTPIEDKVEKAFPGRLGLLRHASLKGLLGKARAGMAKQPADYAAAEADLLDAYNVFAKNRGEKDRETREWMRALADLYAAWDKAEPGKGYDEKAAEWEAKLGAGPPG